MDRSDTKPSMARKLLKVLGLSLLALLVLHIGLQFINLEVYHQQHGQFYELSNRFDFDDESSVPTWFSQFLYLLIAAGAALAAYLQKDRRTRRLWVIIAAVTFAFSIDEIASLHEFVLQTLHVMYFQDAGPSSLNNAWLIVAPFIVLAAGFFIASMARHFPRRTLVLFSISVVTFLVGAVGVDLFTSLVERESFMNQGLLVGIEEMFELLSLVIVAYAVTDYLERQHDVVSSVISRFR